MFIRIRYRLNTQKLDILLSGKLREAASAHVRKTGFDILAITQSGVRVDTGYLKSSYAAGGPENILQIAPNGLAMIVGSGVEYSGFQEWGTRFQPANPALGRAVEAVRPAWEAGVSEIVARALA